MAFDGCRSVKVPDTGRNRAWLGKMNAALGVTGYPVIQLMTLCETGTRALLGAVFGSTATITDAVATVLGTDPDRASYQIAVQTARTLVTGARGVATGASDLAGDIGRAVLASLHGPCRPRVRARRVKSPLSRWNKHPPGKPRTCQRITSITTAIRGEHQPAATRGEQCVTTACGP